MKIGILTAHYSHNYGAFLQAYALSNLLIENTGNYVEIIDFNMKKTNANKLPDLSGFSSEKVHCVKEKYRTFESNEKDEKIIAYSGRKIHPSRLNSSPVTDKKPTFHEEKAHLSRT